MDIDRSNYSYTFTEYESDVRSLRKTLSEIKNIHLISVYRGSIPIVVHLSNVLNCEMSIIRLHESNENTAQIEFLLNNIKENQHLVVIEDIYDTGRTMQSIQRMMEVEYKNHTISYYSLFGRKNDDGVIYLNEKKKKWITFHWEHI
jgi:hypoxanthine-guanine phosphoribosyltransferase